MQIKREREKNQPNYCHIYFRPQATLEGLAKLKPVFKKDGVVTAGNASVSEYGCNLPLIALLTIQLNVNILGYL